MQQHLYTVSGSASQPRSDCGLDSTDRFDESPSDGSTGSSGESLDDVHDLDDVDVAIDADIAIRRARVTERAHKCAQPTSGSIRQSSRHWHHLRTDARGADVMFFLIQHLLMGVESVHSKAVVHRDIKLSNLILNTNQAPLLKVADFGSAFDDHSLRNLYPETVWPPRLFS